ncbi:MAG: hypothetical protein RL769_220 [Pseudomonadota bacterium]|jgi:hypothetical protein
MLLKLIIFLQKLANKHSLQSLELSSENLEFKEFLISKWLL